MAIRSTEVARGSFLGSTRAMQPEWPGEQQRPTASTAVAGQTRSWRHRHLERRQELARIHAGSPEGSVLDGGLLSAGTSAMRRDGLADDESVRTAPTATDHRRIAL